MVSGASDNGYSFEGEGLAGFATFFQSIRADYIPESKSVVNMHILDPTYSDGRDFSSAMCDSLRSGFGLCAMFDHGNFFHLKGKTAPGGSIAYGAPLPIDYDNLGTTRPPVVIALGSHLGEFDYTVDKVGKQLWENTGPCVPSLAQPPLCVLEQSNARIDSADVMPERLIVQSGGAIGVLALNRSMLADRAELAFRAFFEGLYVHHAGTLGEALVIPKLLGRITDDHWTRGMALFGDPAVHLRWTDVAHDSVDLAIRPLDIGAYVSSNSGHVTITVRNEGPEAATNVAIEAWNGHPDSTASSLIGSSTLAVIAGYDTVVTAVPVDVTEGALRLFILLDPDSVIAEPDRDNNRAWRYSYALPYLPAGPIRLPEPAHHSVVIADVHPTAGKEILITMTSRIHCYKFDGSLLWSFARSATSIRTGPVVANFEKDGNPQVLCEFGGYSYRLEGASGAVTDSIAITGATNEYGFRPDSC